MPLSRSGVHRRIKPSPSDAEGSCNGRWGGTVGRLEPRNRTAPTGAFFASLFCPARERAGVFCSAKVLPARGRVGCCRPQLVSALSSQYETFVETLSLEPVAILV